ncbi:sigma-70 region 4 domain-containing protein [Micromonospora sp. WMMD975]|nr:sigma-70 region 4 domain-containing protein [Micromonospora sp. WMMD975]WFE32964.1 sigma-70 region 4 domain-containing protein [Micromonospora sp. WMMD975]
MALLEALATLPADQRRAIVLHHLAHLSVAEIAAQVGAPEGIVRSRLSRGRATLAGHLTETGSELRRA